MTPTLHHCFAHGMVVAGRDWIPQDPFEWAPSDSILPAVGCNNLRCAQCGAQVRSLRGVTKPVTGADPAHLYTILAEGLPHDAPARLYMCRCHALTIYAAQALESEDAIRDLSLPWACAGHPPPPHPLTLDGDLIPLDPLLPTTRALLRAHLPSRPHPTIQDLAGFQAIRVMRLLDDPGRRALEGCVAQCLTDPDPAIRRGALGFCRLWPSGAAAEHLLSLRSRRNLWSTPDPISPSVTLQYTFRLALDAIKRHKPPSPPRTAFAKRPRP